MEALGNFVLTVLVLAIGILLVAWPAMWALGLFGLALGYWQVAGLLVVLRLVARLSLVSVNTEVKS